MSKIPVGSGWSYPDSTEQDTAGVVTSTGRDFYFNPSGDDDLDGTSIERALQTPLQAVALINALVPPPSSSDTSSLNAAVTGSYSDALVLPDSVSVNCEFASIVNFTPSTTILTGGSQQESVWGALLSFGANTTTYMLDSVTNHKASSTAMVIGSDTGIGFEVKGVCDNTFASAVQMELRGPDCKGVLHTATSASPIVYTFNLVELFEDNQTFFDFDPAGPSSQTTVRVNAAQIGEGASGTGSVLYMVRSGILVIEANVLTAETVLEVEVGAQASFNADVCAGDIVVRGGAVLRSLGFYTGNLTTSGTAAVTAGASQQTGNILVDDTSTLIYNSNLVVGDITVNGRLDCIIHNHIGTLTNNGEINGIINGVRYGSWDVRSTYPYLFNKTEDVLIDSDTTPVIINEVTFVNQPAGLWELTFSLILNMPDTNDYLEVEFTSSTGFITTNSLRVEPKDADNKVPWDYTVPLDLAVDGDINIKITGLLESGGMDATIDACNIIIERKDDL